MKNEKFYQKTWFTVLFLILCFPIGIFTMWKYQKFNKFVRILVSVCVVICVVCSFLGSEDDSNTSISKTETTTAVQKKSTELKPNTSQMVDDIAHRAKKSANRAITKEKRDTAINFIVKHYPNYFTNNKVMEKTMYYGYYLEYAYAKNGPKNLYANLGIDTYQAVKGVYRNVDKTTDDIVVENLRQIKEGLRKLGYKVN